MHTWITLLRGINVGGNNPLPMRELVVHLETLGLTDVKTYLQSGNAVFRAPKKRKSPAALEKQIAGHIEQHHRFRPRVLILTPDALERAATQNPFPEGEADPKTLHLSFLAEPARGSKTAKKPKPDLAAMESLKSPTERYQLIDRVFYLHAPDGIGHSKLAAKAEQLLAVECTARNWRTVQKLHELAKDVGD